MKKCNTCLEDKPFDAFHKRAASKDGLQNKCKDCNNTTVRAWMEKNPDKFEQNWKRNSYGEEALLKRRAAKYGLSVEELSKMIEDSGGKCAICKTIPDGGLNVDHCHTSGKVRGLLCNKCNTAIGLFKDNPEYLLSAINYLN